MPLDYTAVECQQHQWLPGMRATSCACIYNAGCQHMRDRHSSTPWGHDREATNEISIGQWKRDNQVQPSSSFTNVICSSALCSLLFKYFSGFTTTRRTVTVHFTASANQPLSAVLYVPPSQGFDFSPIFVFVHFIHTSFSTNFLAGFSGTFLGYSFDWKMNRRLENNMELRHRQ